MTLSSTSTTEALEIITVFFKMSPLLTFDTCHITIIHWTIESPMGSFTSKTHKGLFLTCFVLFVVLPLGVPFGEMAHLLANIARNRVASDGTILEIVLTVATPTNQDVLARTLFIHVSTATFGTFERARARRRDACRRRRSCRRRLRRIGGGARYFSRRVWRGSGRVQRGVRVIRRTQRGSRRARRVARRIGGRNRRIRGAWGTARRARRCARRIAWRVRCTAPPDV